MPGDLLDLILLVLIAAFAVAGYRQGFIIGVFSLAGFVLGVAVGAYFAPGISRDLAKSTQWQAFAAIVVVFLAAVLGMLVASGIGVAVRSRITWRPATVVDSLGGAAVNVVAVLLVAWLIGGFVENAPAFPSIARQVNNSVVLQTVDRIMPKSTLYLPFFPQLRTLLSNGLDQQVFSAIGAETSLNLASPDPAVVNSAAVARDKPSIVKIEGVALSCSQRIEGSGFVISPQHVLTNAHVVAGVNEGPDVYTNYGDTYRAQVVLYDPQRDLAVLYVPGLDAPPLQFDATAPDGGNAVVAGYPLNGPFDKVPARVGSSVPAYGPNIYQTGAVHREIYPIKADIRPGNSGGPLLSPGGRVYGVVFAAATSIADTGYALTAGEVASDVAAGSREYSPVSTESCQDGG